MQWRRGLEPNRIFFSSRRRHTRFDCDWSSGVCSSDLMEYTVEAGANGARALRIGLMQVKGLRVETIMAILRMREEAGTFRSLDDFLHRVTVERDEIQALIKCGADRKSTRLNSSHSQISYAVFCLKKQKYDLP